jgi:hypothetical protein
VLQGRVVYLHLQRPRPLHSWFEKFCTHTHTHTHSGMDVPHWSSSNLALIELRLECKRVSKSVCKRSLGPRLILRYNISSSAPLRLPMTRAMLVYF